MARKKAPVVTLVPKNSWYNERIVENLEEWLKEARAGNIRTIGLCRMENDGSIVTCFGTNRLGVTSDCLTIAARLTHRVQLDIDHDLDHGEPDDPDPGENNPLPADGTRG